MKRKKKSYFFPLIQDMLIFPPNENRLANILFSSLKKFSITFFFFSILNIWNLLKSAMKIQKSKLLFKLQRALCDKACDEVSHSGISAVNFLAPHCLQPHAKGASTSSGTSEHLW